MGIKWYLIWNIERVKHFESAWHIGSVIKYLINKHRNLETHVHALHCVSLSFTYHTDQLIQNPKLVNLDSIYLSETLVVPMQ